MEVVDLVNENDQVVGITHKEEADRNGDIHRIIAIFVFTEDGRLYLQEHLKSGGKFDHSVGGHVGQGESYDKAAKREAEEELGLTDPLTIITVFYSDETFSGTNTKHMIGLYECIQSDKWEFRPNEEVQKIIPMEIEGIVALMNKDPKKFTGGFINTMKEFIKQKNLLFKMEI
jgi:isopentenyldiphosphate isomerase